MKLLEFQDVSFSYLPKSERRKAARGAGRRRGQASSGDGATSRKWGDSPESVWALRDVSFSVERGQLVGVVGHTGSGKSTLMTLAAGLARPTSGRVLLDGIDISTKKGSRQARGRIGVVFQNPESQLFAQAVSDDVAFGPRNLGLSGDEVDRRVASALVRVGLDVEEIGGLSPFVLSGGQQRRVALAGVFAMHPDVLVLDEPTAGLDPASRDALLSLVQDIRRECGVTVVLVSHDMDGVGALCDRVIVLNRGRMFADASPMDVFGNADAMKSVGLGVPKTLSLAARLGMEGFTHVPTSGELAALIVREAKLHSRRVLGFNSRAEDAPAEREEK